MILTAYFDESGTHDESPITVVAGVLGNAAQWRKFEVNLQAIQRKYNFRIFHAKEFRARSGEFRGWQPSKCVSLAMEMAELTAKSGIHGVIMSFKNSEFEEFYRGGEKPRKLRLDTKYTLAFRSCLLQFVVQSAARLQHHKKFHATRLHVVMESGHKNAGDAARAFREEADDLRELGSDLLAEITFASKKECLPIMVADFLAYTRFIRGERDFDQLGDDLKSIPEKGSLIHLGFNPGGIAEYKADLINRWNARGRR